MPYFKMVRKMEAAKQFGLREIFLRAMTGGFCVQLPPPKKKNKMIRIGRKRKRGATIEGRWKAAATRNHGLAVFPWDNS